MLTKIQEIIRNYKDDDSVVITEDTKLTTELGLSSIDFLSLFIEIEDEYGVKIPDQQMAAFQTVGDVIAYLEGQL